jgi:hypothetical protein
MRCAGLLGGRNDLRPGFRHKAAQHHASFSDQGTDDGEQPAREATQQARASEALARAPGCKYKHYSGEKVP